MTTESKGALRHLRTLGMSALTLHLLLLLPLASPVLNSPMGSTYGFVLDEFTTRQKQMSTTFTGPGENTTGFALQFPPGTTLTSAWLNITGQNDGSGNYPMDLKIDVGDDGDVDWAFNSTGFGPLGQQSLFEDDKSLYGHYFSGSGQDTIDVILPKRAQVTSASLKIKGGASLNYEPYIATCDNVGSLYYMADNGDGTFGPAQYHTDVTGSSGHTGVAIADYDNDGDYDMVIGRAWSGTGTKIVYYYQKTGPGKTFAGANTIGSTLSCNQHPMDIEAGDFTGDGNADFITCCHQQPQGRIWVGDGSGGFTPTDIAFDMYYSYGKAAGDFDEDGDLDIAMGGRPQSGPTNILYIFLNNGNGLTYTSRQFNTETNYGITAGDFDADGHLDILTSISDARWYLHSGYGNGSFASPVYTGLDVGTNYGGYGCSRDFDLDGDDDLLSMSDYSAAVLKFYPNIGSAGFGTPVQIGDVGTSCMGMGIPYGHEPIGASDATLDIGGDSLMEWSTAGVCTGLTDVTNLATSFNNYLATATSFQDPYGNDMVNVPLVLSSTSEGYIGIRDMKITYTFEATADTNPHSGNLANEINEYLATQPAPPEGQNITVPIKMISGSAGGVLLSSLHFEYNAYPISYFIPDQTIQEGADEPTFLDLSFWFKDDYDLPDALAYTVVFNSQEGVLDVAISGHFVHINLTTNPHWNSPTNGTFTLQLKAMDTSYLNSTSNMFNITVEPLNDEPYPSIPIPDVYMAEDSEDTSINFYDIQYFVDPEPFDDIYYDVEIDPLDVYEDEQLEAEIDPKTKELTLTAFDDFNTGEGGDPIPLWIYADDSPNVKTYEDGPGTYSYQEVLVWVEPVNDPPEWGTIPPITLLEDSPQEYIFDLDNAVIDVDNTPSDFTYDLIENDRYSSVEFVIGSDGNISVPSLQENWFGSAQIEVEVSDGLDDVRTTFTIDVAPVNDLPVITVTEPAQGQEVSGEVLIKGRLEDVDNQLNELEMQLQMGESPWAPMEAGPFWTYPWNTTGEVNGPITLKFRAFDGLNYSEPLLLNLTIYNELAHPPQVSFISPSDGETVSGVITLTGLSTDPDGDAVTVFVRIGSGPQWLGAMDSAPWRYEWNTSTIANGPVTVTVRAFDGLLYSPEISRSFNVHNIVVNETDGNGTTGDGDDGLNVLVISIIVIIVIAVVIMVLLLVFRKKKKEPETPPTTQAQMAPPTTPPVLTLSTGIPPSAATAYQQQSIYQPPFPTPPPMLPPPGPYRPTPPVYSPPQDPYQTAGYPYSVDDHPYQSISAPPTDPYQTPQYISSPFTEPLQAQTVPAQSSGASSSQQQPSPSGSGERLALPSGDDIETVMKERVASQLDLVATYNFLIELSKQESKNGFPALEG